MFRGFASKGKWRDVNAVDGSSVGTHLDVGHTGDDGRHADGDEELVGTRSDLLEDIFVADMGMCGWRSDEKTEE
jgi:hypothetical protein